ncbi:MAG: fibrobacter succinogenes major paralogous domain-containing protein [Fibrobacteria bacterium]|nr:fibrobacter succinogenes major paralogous domain-containing protein [Fibrobacteria bacterium]
MSIFLACTERMDPVWISPYDEEGGNWSPPKLTAMDDAWASIYDTLTLTASGIDSNGTILKYYWALGGLHYFDSTSKGEITFVCRDSGIQTILVKARDNDGLFSEEDTIIISVASNAPIITAIKAVSGFINDSLTLVAVADDMNGVVEQYYWALDGRHYADSTFAGVFKTSFGLEGLYTVLVMARDDDSIFSTPGIIPVTVRMGFPLTKGMEDVSIPINDSIHLTAAAYDSNGIIEAYYWALNGQQYNDSTQTEAFVTAFSIPGKYVIYVKVRDDDLLFSESDSFVVNVERGAPFVVPVKDTTVSAEDSVRITVSASDVNINGAVKQYYWDTGEVGWDDSTTHPWYTFSKKEGGTLTVIWAAKDDDGIFSRDTFAILFNRKPTTQGITASFDQNSWVSYDRISQKGSLSISIQATDPDGGLDTLLYTLSLGDTSFLEHHVYTGSIANYTAADLTPNDSVYWFVQACDMRGECSELRGHFVTPSPPPVCTPDNLLFTDVRDGSSYTCVTLGSQIWMKENLAYLPKVDSMKEGSEFHEKGKFYYVYDFWPSNDTQEELAKAKATTNYQTYGVLYNWYAAMDGADSSSTNPSGVQGVCPDGMHLPSDEEFKILEMFFGMTRTDADDIIWRGTSAGKKMRHSSFGGTDTHGFSVLPAGLRQTYANGSFFNLDHCAYLWTSTADTSFAGFAHSRVFSEDENGISRGISYKDQGKSVRCLID